MDPLQRNKNTIMCTRGLPQTIATATGKLCLGRPLRSAWNKVQITRPPILVGLLVLGLAVPVFPQRKPDFTQFVVMGEGLAAGFGDFQLKEVNQTNSFPAQIARKTGSLFPQPLIQTPGIGNAPGFPTLPVRVPNTLQTTVRVAPGAVPARENGQPQPNVFVFNVSIPNQKVADALTRRPSLPLVQADMQQTTINMILGFPGLVSGPNKPAWTQMQYVQFMRPSFAILAMGYADVLPAAVSGDLAQLPDLGAFKTNYAAIIAGLKVNSQVLVVNIPDPTDTAYFSTLASASELLLASPATIAKLYSLKADDQITLPGLFAMGDQLAADKIGPLPDGSIVSADTIAAIKARVTAMNTEIASQASSANMPVYDVRTLFSQLRANGYITTAGQFLSADAAGGLYTLSGYYPGATVHALIANGVLALMNKTYGTNLTAVNVDAVVAADPTIRVTPNLSSPLLSSAPLQEGDHVVEIGHAPDFGLGRPPTDFGTLQNKRIEETPAQ